MSNFTKLNEIVRKHQHQEIQEKIVDVQTANAILKLYESLNEKNKKDYKNTIERNIERAAKIAWRLVD